MINSPFSEQTKALNKGFRKFCRFFVVLHKKMMYNLLTIFN